MQSRESISLDTVRTPATDRGDEALRSRDAPRAFLRRAHAKAGRQVSPPLAPHARDDANAWRRAALREIWRRPQRSRGLPSLGSRGMDRKPCAGVHHDVRRHANTNPRAKTRRAMEPATLSQAPAHRSPEDARPRSPAIHRAHRSKPDGEHSTPASYDSPAALSRSGGARHRHAHPGCRSGLCSLPGRGSGRAAANLGSHVGRPRLRSSGPR